MVDAVFVIAVVGSWVVGITLLARLRHEVYRLGEPHRPVPTAGTAVTTGGVPAVDPAVRQVLYARERRAQARGVATADPLMARELRIGRPDLRATTTTADWSTSPARPRP